MDYTISDHFAHQRAIFDLLREEIKLRTLWKTLRQIGLDGDPPIRTSIVATLFEIDEEDAAWDLLDLSRKNVWSQPAINKLIYQIIAKACALKGIPNWLESDAWQELAREYPLVYGTGMPQTQVLAG